MYCSALLKNLEAEIAKTDSELHYQKKKSAEIH